MTKNAVFTIALIFFVLVFCQPGQLWAGAEDDYQDAKAALKAFEKNKERHKYRESWKRLIGKFEKITKKYPKHKRACDSIFNTARLYNDMAEVSRLRSDREEAIRLYSSLSKKCSRSSLADDGLYRAANIKIVLGDEKSARRLFTRVIDEFPKGDMRGKAKKSLAGLGGPLRDKKKSVAQKNKDKKTTEKKSSSSIVKETDTLIIPNKDKRLLEKIEYSSSAKDTEVRLHFNRLPAFTQGEIPAETGRPRRLYFDFNSTIMKQGEPSEYFPEDGRVKMIRFGMFQSETLRLVFELSPIANRFTMKTSIDPASTVITIHSGRPGLGKTASAQNKIGKSQKTSIPKVDDFYKVKVITIDPGHGGEDFGAVGKGGTKEKDIVLKVSRYLRDILKKRFGVKVVMTRSSDKEVELMNRAKIANKAGSDLFVSVHANAVRRRDIYGIETYYLNNSKDSYSRRLAERENRALGHKASDLDFILADLSMNVNVSDSIKLANYVQSAMVGSLKKKYTKIEDRGVGRAVFYVLLNTRMPSVLVETSFISNPREEKRLKDPAYQKRLAESIADGIGRYINYQKKMSASLN